MSLHSGGGGPIPEPTYRLGPSEEEKFYPSKVEGMMESVCSDFFSDKPDYVPSLVEEWSHALSSKLLAALRSSQHLPRYKLICQVSLIQQQGQGVTVSSKSLCDVSTDNWASCTFRSKGFVCSAMIFGFYHE